MVVMLVSDLLGLGTTDGRHGRLLAHAPGEWRALWSCRRPHDEAPLVACCQPAKAVLTAKGGLDEGTTGRATRAYEHQ